MSVKKEWIERFTFEVPRSIRRRLINLGLPVAGIDFEVKSDGSVVFDGVLRVSRDGKFYWGRRQLTTREFVNIASLLSHYDAELVEELPRLVDLRVARVLNGTDLKVGRAVLVEAIEARVMDFIHWAKKISQRIPPRTELVYFRDGMSVVVHRSPFRAEARYYYDDASQASEVELYYRNLYFTTVKVKDLGDALQLEDFDEVVRLVDRNVMSQIQVRTTENFREYSCMNHKVYEFDGVVAVMREGDPIKVYRAADRALINNGWTFYHIGGDMAIWGNMGIYKKRIGAIRLDYRFNMLKITFVNGATYLTPDPGILLHSKDLNTYFELLPMV